MCGTGVQWSVQYGDVCGNVYSTEMHVVLVVCTWRCVCGSVYSAERDVCSTGSVYSMEMCVW